MSRRPVKTHMDEVQISTLERCKSGELSENFQKKIACVLQCILNQIFVFEIFPKFSEKLPKQGLRCNSSPMRPRQGACLALRGVAKSDANGCNAQTRNDHREIPPPQFGAHSHLMHQAQ